MNAINDKQEKPQTLKDFPYRAIGISNKCTDDKENPIIPEQFRDRRHNYSIQFYDFDMPEGMEKMTEKMVQSVLEIFPYDCFMYKTKHGFHFISLALLRGLHVTKSRVVRKTKALLFQDYWTKRSYLTLRVSHKYKNRWYSKWYEIISPKPEFFCVCKEPSKGLRISGKHLEFYYNYMGLPKWVYESYLNNCNVYNLNIELHHYPTKD